jgi:hypothetical protein
MVTSISYSTASRTAAVSFGGSFSRRGRNAMTDERDHEIEQLRRQLRWAREDNERVWKLLDDALVSLRQSNNRAAALTEARAADARERVAQAEERLANAVLAARAPDVKLH